MRLFRVELPQWVAEPRLERLLYGPTVVWSMGVAVPALLALYGLGCMLRAQAMVIGYVEPFFLSGLNAVIYGIGVVALAVLLHCACFWDSLYESTLICARAKLLCLGIMGICAYTFCFRMLPGLWA